MSEDLERDLRFRVPKTETNIFGNPLPICVDGLVPTPLTICVMSYRGNREACALAELPVVRNLALQPNYSGQARDSADHLMFWQNCLPNEAAEIDTRKIVAAMVQCVGAVEPLPCNRCTKEILGAFVGCVRMRRSLGPELRNWFLQGACANHYYDRRGNECSFRTGYVGDSGDGGGGEGDQGMLPRSGMGGNSGSSGSGSRPGPSSGPAASS